MAIPYYDKLKNIKKSLWQIPHFLNADQKKKIKEIATLLKERLNIEGMLLWEVMSSSTKEDWIPLIIAFIHNEKVFNSINASAVI